MLSIEKLNDVHKLLIQARKIKNQDDTGLKIAVLGSCSIQFFVFVLRYLLKEEGICSNIYEGEYNAIYSEICNPTSGIYSFKPEVVILLPDYRDIIDIPDLLEDKTEVKKKIDSTVRYYQEMWIKLQELHVKYVIQSNFVIPNIHQLGNLENTYLFGRNFFYRKVNEALVETKYSNVCIADLDALACDIGKNQWFDYSAYFLNKAGYRLEYIGQAVYLFVQLIKAYKGNIKKCLILDLDNTLWGGVVADEGYNKIQLDPNHPIGEAYQFFQEYIMLLKRRGVILAVCSKNDESIAKEPFLKNEFMKLGLEDISCFVSNWDEKTNNLIAIAEKINIGLDSLVFFDDNPIERELVRKTLPEVQVIEVSENPENYVQDIEREKPFEWLAITKEDTTRTQSYSANIKRSSMARQYENYHDFLRDLKMEAKSGLVDENSIDRFVQLINKSNQFNLRTMRYTRENVLQFSSSSKYRCIYIELKDKFSNYGIIACVILKKIGTDCFIDSWVMSCRVLRRDVEKYTFNTILKYSLEMKCNRIIGEYIPTRKNQLVKDLFTNLDFDKISDKIKDKEQYQYRNLLKSMPGCEIFH